MAEPERTVPPEAVLARSAAVPREPVRRRWVRRIERCIAWAALTVILFIVTPVSAWIFRGMDCQSELKKADYILCLGGNASRIIESARLLQEGWAKKLVVSNHGEFADEMRDMAIEWGADPAKVLVDRNSFTTRDHPGQIQAAVGVDPARDTCIVVTSYTHLQRARACFVKAGYQHVLMREPRWERRFRAPEESTWKARFLIFPQLVYEGAAWVEYWFRGVV